MIIKKKTETYILTKEIAEKIIFENVSRIKKISKILDKRILDALSDNKTISETKLKNILCSNLGNSVRVKSFWINRGYSSEEAEEEVRFVQKCSSPRSMEYYIIRKIPETIAKKKISKFQATASLIRSMSSHGPILGYIKYNPKKYISTVEDTSVYNSSDISLFIRKYGDKALEEQKKFFQSRGRSGPLNAQFGKPAPKGSGQGISGYYKGHYFRSSFELRFIINSIKNNVKFIDNDVKKSKLEEKIVIPYEVNGRYKNYIPDYQVGNTVIEVKPSSLVHEKINQIKFEAAKKYCKKHDKKFIILTEKDIPKCNLNDPNIIIDSGKIDRFNRLKNKETR